MPTPRKPAVLQELTGAFAQNPHRRRAPAPSNAALPARPPAWLKTDAEAVSAWRELVKNAPAGVLTVADGPAVELAAVLLARLRRGELRRAAEVAQLRGALADLGRSPASREKVAPVTPPQENRLEALTRGAKRAGDAAPEAFPVAGGRR